MLQVVSEVVQYALIVRDHIRIAIGLCLHCTRVNIIEARSDPTLTEYLAYLIEALIGLADVELGLAVNLITVALGEFVALAETVA